MMPTDRQATQQQQQPQLQVDAIIACKAHMHGDANRALAKSGVQASEAGKRAAFSSKTRKTRPPSSPSSCTFDELTLLQAPISILDALAKQEINRTTCARRFGARSDVGWLAASSLGRTVGILLHGWASLHCTVLPHLTFFYLRTTTPMR